MRDESLYILDEDKKYALDRITELENEIQNLGPEFYDVFNQSSETWHDNAPFDALRDRQSVLVAELHGLKKILKNAEVSIPKPKKDRVGIGAKVTVSDIDGSSQRSFFIAGDWTYRAGEVENDATIVSTKSPIAQELIGHKLGETVVIAKRNTAIQTVSYE